MMAGELPSAPDLTSSGPLFVCGGVLRATSRIDTTNDSLSTQVRCETFVAGLLAHCFQHLKCVVRSSNKRAPYCRTVRKNFENIVLVIHRSSCLATGRNRKAKPLKPVCSILHTFSKPWICTACNWLGEGAPNGRDAVFHAPARIFIIKLSLGIGVLGYVSLIACCKRRT
jgi:hypothetical protein